MIFLFYLFLGPSLTNGTSAQAAALNALTSNTLNSSNHQQMAIAQMMLSQLGYSIPSLSLSQQLPQAQSNNSVNILAGLNIALNPTSFNLPQSSLNNSQQPLTSTNSNINSILNTNPNNNNWALNQSSNLNTSLNNNNNDLNLQQAFLQSLLLPTVFLFIFFSFKNIFFKTFFRLRILQNQQFNNNKLIFRIVFKIQQIIPINLNK